MPSDRPSPSPSMARTIAVQSSPTCRSRIKLWSILILSNGNRRRELSDEYPVRKSFIDTRTPKARIYCRVARTLRQGARCTQPSLASGDGAAPPDEASYAEPSEQQRHAGRFGHCSARRDFKVVRGRAVRCAEDHVVCKGMVGRQCTRSITDAQARDIGVRAVVLANPTRDGLIVLHAAS